MSPSPKMQKNKKERKTKINMINIIADFLFFMTLIICIIAKIKNIKSNREENWDESELIKKYGTIFLLIIFLLLAVILTHKIENIPQGLHVDEAGALYDAICISKYGVDRYLYKLPVYLINFGGGQSTLYAYLAAIMIKVFGANMITFRLPSVILSLISLVFLYKTVDEKNGRKEVLFAVFILAICPWNIMKSRWGLDCNLMSSFLIISICLLLKAVNKNKQYLFVISGIAFGITLYTYVISYIILPAILGVVLLYLLIIKKIKVKNIIAMAIPLGILAIPLILMISYNKGWLRNVQIPIFSVPKLWFYRGGEISFKNIPENISQIFEVLFIKDFLNYNAIPEFGTLYKMSIPLVIFGLIEVVRKVIKNIKQKEFSLDFMMLVTFVTLFLLGLCIGELNINKINAIYIPMIYFAGRFLAYIANKIKYAWLAIIIMYCVQGGLFLHYYFTEFAATDLIYFENEIIEASSRAEELQKDKIYIENCVNQTYIYTLIATPISPYEFNENLHIENGVVTEYGKYKFEIPQEINENAVYIIKNDIEKINELIQNGFEMEQYGEFYVVWNETT